MFIYINFGYYPIYLSNLLYNKIKTLYFTELN